MLKIDDKVMVLKQVGKNGTPIQQRGKILNFSNIILVDGEQTAYIQYIDGGGYFYPLSKIKKIDDEIYLELVNRYEKNINKP